MSKQSRGPAAGQAAMFANPASILAGQLVERYAKTKPRDVSGEARAADGTWTKDNGGSAPANIGKWLKERTELHASDFRRDLETLCDEDLAAALEHVRSRGTALEQHRQTAPLKAEMRSRGIEAPPLPTGADVALQAIDEGRNLTSVRKAIGLKAGPEHARLLKQTAAAYERMTRPEAHQTRRLLDHIEDGSERPGKWTKAARDTLGIESHKELLEKVAAAIRANDNEFLHRFNAAMNG